MSRRRPTDYRPDAATGDAPAALPRATYTVAEVAARTGLSYRSACRAVHRGTFGPPLRVGKLLLVPVSGFEAWLTAAGGAVPAARPRRPLRIEQIPTDWSSRYLPWTPRRGA